MGKPHLYRPGGIESEGSTPGPSDIGSRFAERASRELASLQPDPDVLHPSPSGRHHMDFAPNIPYGDTPALGRRKR